MNYLHGYQKEEQERLIEQARFQENLVFDKIDFSKCNHILEIGCGVGGQTEILLNRFPKLNITAIDYSPEQLEVARERLGSNNRVRFIQGNAEDLSFLDEERFDGAFFCWVLEHVLDPQKIISETSKYLKENACIYITEVLNHNFVYYPQSAEIDFYWKQFNQLQTDLKGHPDIGLLLGNILYDAGFSKIKKWTRTFFYDKSEPEKRLMAMNYWHTLLKSAANNLIAKKYITELQFESFNEAFDSLKKESNGVIYYAFVQASAEK